MSGSLPAPTLASFLRERCARELAHALRLLSDGAGNRDAAVHEARKGVRRVRAWLRLGSRSLREGLAPVDAALRKVRRTLGPLRDAHTRLEALDRLRKRRDLGELRAFLVEARKHFADRLAARWHRCQPQGAAWRRMLAALAALERSVPDWPLQALEFKDAARALRRSQRRAREARRECAGRSAAVQRHAWRGRVRVLALQCQLLEAFGALSGSGELKALGQALGEEHDLAVVSRELGRLPLPPEAREQLRAYLRRHRRLLAQRNDRNAREWLRPGNLPKLRKPRRPTAVPALAKAPPPPSETPSVDIS